MKTMKTQTRTAAATTAPKAKIGVGCKKTVIQMAESDYKAAQEKKQKQQVETVAVVSPYKGQPIFGIHNKRKHDNGEDFSQIIGFGVNKAKLVLEYLEEIKAFVAENE